MKRIILHSDLNNFFASVECRFNPSLRNRPVAVAGNKSKRHGIILAKNEIAKRFGVKTGEALWQAQRKCPEIVFVPPHFDRYMEFSRAARQIYGDYTDMVESFGIDECWLDVSASTRLLGSAEEIAHSVRQRIKAELGVTVSVGVSFNKVFAKLGSDMKKPDAVTVITPENFKDKIWPLPVSDMLYVGRATDSALKKYGICTIGQLAAADINFLTSVFGKHGAMLRNFANGIDPSPVLSIGTQRTIKSIGNSVTAAHDLTDDSEIRQTLYKLCEIVSSRLRKEGLLCRTVQLSVRDCTLSTIERQTKFIRPERTSAALFDKAYSLFVQNKNRPVRSLGIRACDLQRDNFYQLSFFDDFSVSDKTERLEQTVDSLRSRFGSKCVRRASLLVKSGNEAESLNIKNIVY